MKTTAEILLHNANNINKKFGNMFKAFDFARTNGILNYPDYVQFPREFVHVSVSRLLVAEYMQSGMNKQEQISLIKWE